jgi:hypothetical protein
MGSWGQQGTFVTQGTVAPTEAAPTAEHDGFSLGGVGGFSLVVQCDEGQTFNAATGSLLAYLHDPLTGWQRAADSALDLPIPAVALGQRGVVFSGFSVANPRGRICHVPSGVGVTGGSLTITYLGTNKRGLVV